MKYYTIRVDCLHPDEEVQEMVQNWVNQDFILSALICFEISKKEKKQSFSRIFYSR